MTKDEALKMAIDWIEKETRSQYTYVDILQACKEALEQPTQEPIGFIHQDMKTLLPVFRFNAPFATYKLTTASNPDIPLYTHPKEWQGLSDDEVRTIEGNCINYGAFDDDIGRLNSTKFANAIEQKLKEKNHGTT